MRQIAALALMAALSLQFEGRAAAETDQQVHNNTVRQCRNDCITDFNRVSGACDNIQDSARKAICKTHARSAYDSCIPSCGEYQ
jgi:hypothetical protein